jgi:hypothetical protein
MPLIVQTDVRYVKLFAMDLGLNFEAFCIRSHSLRHGLKTRVPGSFGAFLRGTQESVSPLGLGLYRLASVRQDSVPPIGC